MKRLSKTLIAVLCVAAMLLCVLTGCDSNSGKNPSSGEKKPLAEATNVTFDPLTGSFSFTGVENASFYYVKVFSVENGQKSSTAVVQSDKIDANSSNSYSGTVNYSFLAGEYVAQVMAAGSGYASSYAMGENVTSNLMAAASVSASWEKQEEVVTGAKITITAGDAVAVDYTVTVTDASGKEVYKNDKAPAGELMLTAEDFGVETLSVDDAYTVTLSINPVDGYTLPANNSVACEITEGSGSGGGPGGPGGS